MMPTLSEQAISFLYRNKHAPRNGHIFFRSSLCSRQHVSPTLSLLNEIGTLGTKIPEYSKAKQIKNPHVRQDYSYIYGPPSNGQPIYETQHGPHRHQNHKQNLISSKASATLSKIQAHSNPSKVLITLITRPGLNKGLRANTRFHKQTLSDSCIHPPCTEEKGPQGPEITSRTCSVNSLHVL